MTLEIKLSELRQDFLKLRGDSMAIYNKILAYGSSYPQIDKSLFKESDLVHGCQSQMFLKSKFENNHLYFSIYSDALISKGIAAILVKIFNEETPEVVLRAKPSFLAELGIISGLSVSRSNGALALFTHMQKCALATLTR